MSATQGRRTCLYKQKHTMPSTSPTISSLLSILKALRLHNRLAVLVRHASLDCARPAKGLKTGPGGLLMQAVIRFSGVAHLAYRCLQVKGS